jgi:hypothetical protein
MSIDNRIISLQSKHDKLENEIRASYNSRISDEIVNSLKKKKLAIKQEIETLETQP